MLIPIGYFQNPAKYQKAVTSQLEKDTQYVRTQLDNTFKKVAAVKHQVVALQHTISGVDQQLAQKYHVNPAAFNHLQTFHITWYCPSGGSGSGTRTATGTTVRNNWTIAVDPSVIPLYSLVYIKFHNGHAGVYQALDTGGAIKGNHIDVFNSNCNHYLQNGWGYPYGQVAILRRGK